MVRGGLALVVACLLPGCANVFYSETPTGSFSGRLDVQWIAPNRFVYRPHAVDPLTYVTADGLTIRPRAMYTDGGSIPRLFWSSSGLGPWDFAPGYIIHDWLFMQRFCKEGDWQVVDFKRSAAILAESIKTQMEKAGSPEPTLVLAIYEAVRSPIAQKIWDSGQCDLPSGDVPMAAAPAPGMPTPVTIMSIRF